MITRTQSRTQSHTQSYQSKSLRPRMNDWLIAFIFALLAASVSLGTAHAAPPAGATIGNQASATYTDDSQITRTVTSNTVVTIVQQVASLTLSANGTKSSNAGGQVAYPHTLTNTGNGADTFSLVPTNTGAFSFTAVQLFADANGDGVPDNNTPITSTGEVPVGGVFRFVAVGSVPNSATTGNTNTLTITAASALTPGTTGVNTDVTTVTVQGVINVTQAIDVTYGPSPAGPRTITLTYTNTGNTTATGVTLTDMIPSGMTYVPNSARWSVTGSGTPLTDTGTADNQSGIVYDFNESLTNRVTAVIASVLPGATGTVTFQVNVNSGLAPGARPATALHGTYAYNDGAAPVGAANTNTVQYTVAQTAAVVVSSDTSPTASQGGTIDFHNTVTNNGNGIDTFNMSVLNQSFPPGTTLQLFRSDGLTPLTDSNNDGLPDTGPIAAGAVFNFVVKTTLPAGVSGNGPYTAIPRATSSFDPSKSGTGTDTLSAIGANSVDLTLDTAGPGSLGVGAGPELSAVTTKTVAPGATTRFTLVVKNNSLIADNFNLLGTTDGTFATTSLPAGWSVVFHDANGALISNTGDIAAGMTTVVYADVTAPNNATTGFDVYFRTKSPSSNVADGLHAAVAVGVVRSLVLTPNNTGQATPGGTTVYTHMIVNTGSVTEGAVSGEVVLSTASSASFTSVVYWDQNNSGTLEASDPIVTDLSQLTGGSNGASPAAGLLPGESARLFVKVTTTPGAANGVTDTTTVSATLTATIGGIAPPTAATATDATTVIVSNVTLVKMQALDATCDGTADTAFTTSSLSTGAIPGACIRYQITATNAGSANVLSVLVNDSTPANTTYAAVGPAATTVGTVTAPSAGVAGAVQATVGTLTSGQSVVLTFGVRIDP